MKKYVYFFIAGLLSLNLLACNPVNGGTENSEDTAKAEILAEKEKNYSVLIGTKWNIWEDKIIDTYSPETIIFKKDEILFGDKKYSVDFDKNVFVRSEIQGTLASIPAPIFFLIDSQYIAFNYGLYKNNTLENTVQVYYSDTKVTLYSLDTSYTGDNGGSSTGEGENLELSGEYVISENHRYGNLVFSNGSWNVTQGTSSGTYSLNGNVLTVVYEAYGTAVSADFTVSVSDSKIILQSSDSQVAAVLGGFGVQDPEALNTGKITLTKN